MAKINVGHASPQSAVFVPQHDGYPFMYSLPLKQVTGYDVLHHRFSLVHDGGAGGEPFVADVVEVGEFLGGGLDERAIGYGRLLEAFFKSHSPLTMEQALRLFRTHDEGLPPSLVLLPTIEAIRFPDQAEAMCLARVVEFGRKRLGPGGFVRHYTTGLALITSQMSFTEDARIVGILK